MQLSTVFVLLFSLGAIAVPVPDSLERSEASVHEPVSAPVKRADAVAALVLVAEDTVDEVGVNPYQDEIDAADAAAVLGTRDAEAK
ncbi:MAG: hypothetical protein M1834_008580 [Cirrosporium novae-zelandiae]|nr:MAG: hypothetical protein M1834_008580 [Cirrosporium novae-zelandiae]